MQFRPEVAQNYPTYSPTSISEYRFIDNSGLYITVHKIYRTDNTPKLVQPLDMAPQTESVITQL